MAVTILTPRDEASLCDAVADAARNGRRLAICGGGSKAGIGAPETDADRLDMRGFDGIVDYDPPELVLTVRAGTPLSVVQSLVAAENQMLAFEPYDHGPIFGQAEGAATIGGVVAAGVAGTQRLSCGGARDHILGLRAVSGRGEMFLCGAKVVKNVTGYDLPKLLAGSWGRLAAITELTLKVLPAPRTTVTMVLYGLDPERAVAAMAAAMASRAEVAAAVHRPGPLPVTALRLQGFPASVAARGGALGRCLEPFGQATAFAPDEAALFWQELRTLASLSDRVPLWRISLPPSAGGMFAQRCEADGGECLLDWAGGLVWLATDARDVRQRAEAAGGHAMLVRAPASTRRTLPAFHPQPQPLAALERRVRRAFDPAGVFETGRYLDEADAD